MEFFIQVLALLIIVVAFLTPIGFAIYKAYKSERNLLNH